MQAKKKRVMVFGVFDGLHEGHRRFLAMARECGDELIAVVARDDMVWTLKQKTPVQNESQRLQALAAMNEVSHAELGDSEIGTYDVVKEHQPDVICLGYDQDALAKDLTRAMQQGVILAIPLRRITAHKPESFKTSLSTIQK